MVVNIEKTSRKITHYGIHEEINNKSPFFLSQWNINVYITNWKDPQFSMGKSTISMGHGFNSKL
jgi:hypothetical protein